MDKQQILIVDDEEVNRAVLAEMFREEYTILEAEDGQKAIDQIQNNSVMEWFQVRDYMKEKELIEKIPVILITGESVSNSEGKAYAYGVADVMHKPFYPRIVKRRSSNIIELYQNKRNMELRLKEQEREIRSQEKEIRKTNEYMIDALSSVVEFRSAETGEHTRRIKYFTRIMLKYLQQYFPKYGITDAQIAEITRASALHDIGKIGIPDSILLKPGRLTTQEFEV